MEFLNDLIILKHRFLIHFLPVKNFHCHVDYIYKKHIPGGTLCTENRKTFAKEFRVKFEKFLRTVTLWRTTG